MKQRQLSLLKKQERAYGGDLLKTRKGRQGGRPLDTKNSMHLVLRSSKAKGSMSFRAPQNRKRVEGIVAKFSTKYGIKIFSLANVGTHLHLHMKLANRHTYRPFIRAVTAAIAMAITGKSRWQKMKEKFWDYRPFTRVTVGFKGFLKLSDYLFINKLEGIYGDRTYAELVVRGDPEIEALLSG